jgi:two-component system sensor histidine kinase YesM
MWLAQLNPHFLFNILNSISVRILMKGDAEHAELLNSLSSFLRMSINRNNEFISLAEELDTIKHYMKLVNFKNKDDISLAVDVPPELLTYQVPRFVLQPLVENAVVHGL